ncbi:hypothetical protein Tco_1276211 [Tanacetum coccineum]
MDAQLTYSFVMFNPDLIGPWLQQFWATASLRSINEVPHIRAMVAGKRVLISEETIRADLLFDDTDGVDCFPKQNSPNFSGRITPLTLPMLEVITALAAEEAHSEVNHSRAKSSPRDAQGTPTQSAAQASILQGTADFQGTAEAQGAANIPQSPNELSRSTDEEVSCRPQEAKHFSTQTDSQAKGQTQETVKKGIKTIVPTSHSWMTITKRLCYEDFDATDAVVAVTPDLEEK